MPKVPKLRKNDHKKMKREDTDPIDSIDAEESTDDIAQPESIIDKNKTDVDVESGAESSENSLGINEQLDQQMDSTDRKVTDLPDTVTVLEGAFGSKVYVVGTAHFSEQSQLDVAQTIWKTQPNVVVLELCESRLNILRLDEKTIIEESKSMGISRIQKNIKEFGFVQGIMYVLLLSMSAHLTKELGMAPGGEFRRAHQEAKRVPGCVIHLGDRPVHITLRRAISSLSPWQKIKLAFGIMFNNEPITKDVVEQCKQKDLLEKMLEEMTGEFPALSQVFVDERDKYLAYSLHLASSPIPNNLSPNTYIPSVVVGVVGIGHISGIVKNWGKVTDEDIPPLLVIPEPTLTSKIFRKSVKISTYGLMAYGCYKYFVPASIKGTLNNLPSKIQDLLQELSKKAIK